MADAPMGIALQQIHRLFDEGTIAGLPDGQLLERFVARGDEAAFRGLVGRHGPMVLGTCRAVLRDPNDVEDAFQATFLVLICKARSIRGGDALGTWLHRVAHRIALQAGAEAARRRTCERMAGELLDRGRPRDEPGDDTRQVLHEELARLSEKYRLPLLLCDLEGKSYAQAAMELNWGEATVRRRLAGARDLLRRRLVRRGVTLSVGVLAANLGLSALANVPPAWVEATVKAAGSMSTTAARIAIGDVVSTTAADLARKLLNTMYLTKLKSLGASTFLLIALGGIAWGLGITRQDEGGVRQTDRMQRTPSASTATPSPPHAERPADSQEPLTYWGRVLDPSGKPFRGARLYLVNPRLKESAQLPIRALSDGDGRFRFQLARSDFDTVYADEPWSYNIILAYAEDYGFAIVGDYRPRESEVATANLAGRSRFVVTNDREGSKELTLQLAPDDVPISGRIIDLEGRPVSGVIVNVVEVRTPADGSLDDWIKAIEERKDNGTFNRVVVNSMADQPKPPGISPVTTGSDGRFLLKGIGRDRIAILQVEGSTIEMKNLIALTRPLKTIHLPALPNRPEAESITLYGASFEHVAAPTRAIEGVVRDQDTGRPLAGILVQSERAISNWAEWCVQAITDEQGRYRLAGLPRGKEGTLLAIPPVDVPELVLKKLVSKLPKTEDLPYLRTQVTVPESRTDRTLQVDFRLKRGVWVTGRILDPSTGKPVRASIDYFAYNDNPHLKGSPRFTWSRSGPSHTRSDYTFRLVAFPGPGVLAANVGPGEEGRATYVMGAGLDQFKHARDDRSLPTQPYMIPPLNYQVLAEIDPAPGTISLNRDLVLEAGRSLPVTVLDTEGKPLTNLRIAGMNDSGHYWAATPPGTSTHTITGLKRGKKRLLSFLDERNRLAGELQLNGDEMDPRTVTLQPWGTLTGRVVDEDGEPMSEGFLLTQVREAFGSGYPRVGKDGRFRVEGLVPGKAYEFDFLLETKPRFRGTLLKDVKVGAGEVKDLGDIVPKPRKSL
jgi:RNA polymerase sigma factor (sigma-70 family)